MRTEVLCIVLVAVFWGGWPLVARTSGHGGPVGSLILSLFSLLPIVLAALWHGEGSVPGGPTLVRLGIAGVLMGAGLVAFNVLANSEMDASTSIPIVDSAMLIVTAAGAIYFFGEALTLQKILGLTLLVAGIAMLRPT